MPLALLQFGWLYLSRAGVLGQRAGARRAEKTKKRPKKGILLFFCWSVALDDCQGKRWENAGQKTFQDFAPCF